MQHHYHLIKRQPVPTNSLAHLTPCQRFLLSLNHKIIPGRGSLPRTAKPYVWPKMMYCKNCRRKKLRRRKLRRSKQKEAGREREEERTKRERDGRKWLEEEREGRTTRRETRNTKVQPKEVDTIAGLFKDLDLSSDGESDAVCPKCGWVYSDDDGVWICCDGCDSWYDIRCTNIRSRRNIPDTYMYLWKLCVIACPIFGTLSHNNIFPNIDIVLILTSIIVTREEGLSILHCSGNVEVHVYVHDNI